MGSWEVSIWWSQGRFSCQKKTLDISISNENLPNINEHLRPETPRLGLLGTVFNEHDTLITKKFALGKTPMQSNQPKACLEEGGWDHNKQWK